MALNICRLHAIGSIMSLIETNDLLYVKEVSGPRTTPRRRFADLHSGRPRYLMRPGARKHCLRGGKSPGCRSTYLAAVCARGPLSRHRGRSAKIVPVAAQAGRRKHKIYNPPYQMINRRRKNSVMAGGTEKQSGLHSTPLLLGKPAAATRVVVAMSGGVDSSVVAALLKEQGYHVIGITLQLYDHGAALHRKGSCCAGQDIYDARQTAAGLGIPHYVLD